MTEFARLDIKVDSSSAKAAQKDLAGLQAQAGKTEDAFASLVKRAAAGVLGAASVAAIAKQADAYSNLSARIRLVTKSDAEFVAARKEVIAIANRTGQALGATGELYTRLARSVKTADGTQGNFLRVTETINKAMVVSGASAQEAEGAIRQLSQGLASGALRGDEFNSVAENSPILMDALAASLKVTRGELRGMAADGELTTDVVFKALLNGGAEIDLMFSKMPATISRATTQLGNAFTAYIGGADGATGSSQKVAGAIELVAHNFDHVANAILAVTVVMGGRYVAGLVAATRASIVATVATKGLSKAIAGIFGGIPGLILTVAGVALSFIDFADAAEEAKEPAEAIVPPIARIGLTAGDAKARIDGLTESLGKMSNRKRQDELNKLANAVERAQRAVDAGGGTPKSMAARLGALGKARREFDEAQKAAESASAKRTKDSGGQADFDKIRLENEQFDAESEASINTQIEARAAIIRKNHEAELKAARGSLENTAIVEKRIAQEIADFKAGLLKAKEAKTKEADDKREAEQEKADAGVAEANSRDNDEQLRRLSERLDIQEQLEIDGARARGDILGAEQLEIERKYRDLANRMQAVGLDTSPLLDLMAFDEAKILLEDFERRLKKIKDDAAAARDALKTEFDASGDRAKFRSGLDAVNAGERSAISSLSAEASAQGLNLPQDPAAQNADLIAKQERLEAIRGQFQDIGLDFDDVSQKISGGLASALVDVANGTKSASDAFREFAASFLADIAQMIVKSLILKSINSALGLPGGFADGGHVGFAGGGYTGGGAKYQEAGIVHRGEYVIPKHIVEQPGSLDFLRRYHAVGTKALPKYPGYAAGGLVSNPGPMRANAVDNSQMMSATMNNSQNFYLVDDPGRIADVLSSPKGREAMVVAISREPSKFKSVLKV